MSRIGLGLRIRGRVQGVGFRWAMCETATRLGLAGWVRNRSDGSVEAAVFGPSDRVAQLCDWARQGPPGAWVSEVETVPLTNTDTAPAEFSSRPTV